MSDDHVLAQMMEVAVHIQFARCMIVSAFTLQVYEWLICFRDEYLYVHKARWTSVKIAYLTCRYYPLSLMPVFLWAWVGNHPASVCRKVVQPLYILQPFLITFAQAVFIIRTYAFTGRNKFILAFLVASWITILGSLLWILIDKYIFIPELELFGDSPCFADNKTHPKFSTNSAFALATFIFESLMTAIVVVHCMRFRVMRIPFAKLFVLQGLTAYLIMAGLHLFMFLVFFTPYDGIAILHGPTSDVIACRLILMFRRRTNVTATIRRGRRTSVWGSVFINDTETDFDDQPIEGWD